MHLFIAVWNLFPNLFSWNKYDARKIPTDHQVFVDIIYILFISKASAWFASHNWLKNNMKILMLLSYINTFLHFNSVLLVIFCSYSASGYYFLFVAGKWENCGKTARKTKKTIFKKIIIFCLKLLIYSRKEPWYNRT